MAEYVIREFGAMDSPAPAKKVDGRIAHCREMARARKISKDETRVIRFRMGKGELEALDEKAREKGCTRSALVRAAIAAQLGK